MAFDLSPPADTNTLCDLEAEQAVLGAILYDAEAFWRVEDRLASAAFAEPVHGRLWATAATMLKQGRSLAPQVLADAMRGDEGFAELGGVRFLADLINAAPPIPQAVEYATLLADLHARRALSRLGAELTHAAQTDATPVAEIVERAEVELTAAQSARKVATRWSLGRAARSVYETALAARQTGGLAGLTTGLIDLDRALGGLRTSDLIIVAGRPSMGKTALGTNIAFNVATGGKLVEFYSLEMSAEQLAARIIADRADVPSDRIGRADLTEAEARRIGDAAAELHDSPLNIDEAGALTITDLASRARRAARLKGVDLIVVDYLQLLRGAGRRTENRVQEVSEITMGLKALAKELSVPVIALSQLSRKVEERDDKRPQLADLRDSGSIEQDADVVMFVYREAYYLGRAEPRVGTDEHLAWCERLEAVRNHADLIIGKHRHGAIATVKLSFREDTTRFGNLAPAQWRGIA